MAIPESLKQLVERMPDPDQRGMFTGDVDKEKIEQAIAAIHQGGREYILGLIEMLVPPGQGDDVKAHYALHCLANHVLKLRDENARRQFAQTVASQLASRPKGVQAYLCQVLQWAGRREACPALGKLLTDEDLCEPAAMALVAIRDGAAEQFRAALPQARGKCRLNVIQGLGAVQDKQSAAVLREALSDPDREVRLAAGWGLARMGDPGVDALLKAADVGPGWERIQATKHCFVLAEKLAASGQALAARQIYAHLRQTRTDPSEAYVRLAAEKALAALQ
ncbi:MAG: HEAT repeat domain-containing protein [Thermoguttaceae bacterium]